MHQQLLEVERLELGSMERPLNWSRFHFLSLLLKTVRLKKTKSLCKGVQMRGQPWSQAALGPSPDSPALTCSASDHTLGSRPPCHLARSLPHQAVPISEGLERKCLCRTRVHQSSLGQRALGSSGRHLHLWLNGHVQGHLPRPSPAWGISKLFSSIGLLGRVKVRVYSEFHLANDGIMGT